MSGRLVVAATPIGNIDDASPRLRAALAHADVIAAEDTRRVHRLARSLGVALTGRVVSYFEGNESERALELTADLRAGRTVLLVTDAGMPAVSDPGFRVVTAAIDGGFDVTALPGPSAVTAALAISGLPSDRFVFEGFLSRRTGERRRRLTDLVAESRTLVFFEAPHRLHATLTDMRDALGADRQGVICRELTKTYEEVRRGTLEELASWAAGNVRGEVTLVVAGAPPVQGVANAAQLAEAVAVRQAAGEPRKEAIVSVAREFGVPRKTVYDAVVAARKTVRPRH